MDSNYHLNVELKLGFQRGGLKSKTYPILDIDVNLLSFKIALDLNSFSLELDLEVQFECNAQMVVKIEFPYHKNFCNKLI